MPPLVGALVFLASFTATCSLVVRQEPIAVYNKETDEYHVQLTCTSHHNTTKAVIWSGPVGMINSTSSDGGEFRLLLPNPVVSGLYACCSPHAVQRDTCTTQSPSIYVDNVDARFTVLETKLSARIKTLEEHHREDDTLKQQQTTSSRTASNAVVFSACSNKHRIQVDPPHYRIINNVATINTGNGYNTTTGIFTAPASGTYAFFASCAAAETERADLFVQDRRIASCLGSYQFRQGNAAGMAYMKVGEEAEYRMKYTTPRTIKGEHWNMFSGFLVYPEY